MVSTLVATDLAKVISALLTCFNAPAVPVSSLHESTVQMLANRRGRMTMWKLDAIMENEILERGCHDDPCLNVCSLIRIRSINYYL